MIQNNTAYLQTLWKKTPVARAVAALPVPETPESEGLQEGTNESPDFHTPKLTMRQWHGKLFDEMDLSSLDSWTPELVDADHWLLAKYHNIFSLDPTGLGCTHSMEHIIKVTDDTSSEEWFRQIPPPLVEEVRNHLKEMLESGAIRPSQSAWCNVVVLVQKKDSGLHFCIDFCCMKEGFLPSAQDTRGVRELSGSWPLFLLGSQIWILANKDGRGVKAVYHLYSR